MQGYVNVYVIVYVIAVTLQGYAIVYVNVYVIAVTLQGYVIVYVIVYVIAVTLQGYVIVYVIVYVIAVALQGYAIVYVIVYVIAVALQARSATSFVELDSELSLSPYKLGQMPWQEGRKARSKAWRRCWSGSKPGAGMCAPAASDAERALGAGRCCASTGELDHTCRSRDMASSGTTWGRAGRGRDIVWQAGLLFSLHGDGWKGGSNMGGSNMGGSGAPTCISLMGTPLLGTWHTPHGDTA